MANPIDSRLHASVVRRRLASEAPKAAKDGDQQLALERAHVGLREDRQPAAEEPRATGPRHLQGLTLACREELARGHGLDHFVVVEPGRREIAGRDRESEGGEREPGPEEDAYFGALRGARVRARIVSRHKARRALPLTFAVPPRTFPRNRARLAPEQQGLVSVSRRGPRRGDAGDAARDSVSRLR